MTDCVTVRLGEVAFESAKRFGRAESDRPVYGVDRTIGLTPEPRYQASNLSRYKRIEQGMFAYNPMRLNIGSIGYCSPDHKPGIVSPDYVVFGCDESRLISKFLDYHTRSSSWRNWINSAGEGSVRERIYFRTIAEYEMALPDITYQRSAIEILDALDSKIKIDRQMNEILERLVRAIYRDWFIDFGPVRRKLAGLSDPSAILGGVAAGSHIAARYSELFPNAMNEAELPDGWSTTPLTKNSVVRQGKYLAKEAMSSSPTNENTVPVHGANGIIGWTAKTAYLHATTLITCRGSNSGMILWAEGPSWVSNNAMAVTPTNGASWFKHFQLLNDPPYDTISGSAQPQITVSSLNTRMYLAPPDAVCRAFDELVGVLMEKSKANRKEISALVHTRDYLLPRLMSGEVHIGGTQRGGG